MLVQDIVLARQTIKHSFTKEQESNQQSNFLCGIETNSKKNELTRKHT
jgi:hypothetical protein